MRLLTFASIAATSLGVLHCAKSSAAPSTKSEQPHEAVKHVSTDALPCLPPGEREEAMIRLHGPDAPDSIPQAMLHGDPFHVLRILAGPEHKSHAKRIGTTLPEYTQGQLALTALMARAPAESVAPFTSKVNPYVSCVGMFSKGRIEKKKLLPYFYDLASFALRIGRVGMLHRMAGCLSPELGVPVLEHYIREENLAMVEAISSRIWHTSGGLYARLPDVKSAAVRVTIEHLVRLETPFTVFHSALKNGRKDIAALALCSEGFDYAAAAHSWSALPEDSRCIVPKVTVELLTPAQTCRHAQALKGIGEHGRAAEVLALCLNHPQGTDLFTAFIAGVDILGPEAFVAGLDIATIGPERAMFYALAAANSIWTDTRKKALESVGASIESAYSVSVARAIGAGVADKEYLLVMIVGDSRVWWTDDDIRRLAFKFTAETALRCVRRYNTMRYIQRRTKEQVVSLFERCVRLAESVTDDARDVLEAYRLPNPPLKPRSAPVQ